MAMTLLNDSSAALSLGELNKNITKIGKAITKLATGMKITGASTDSASFAISEIMRVRIRALEQDIQNVQNGSALLKTAEAGIQNQIETLKTIREKVIDACNDSNSDEDRMIIQKEINQLYDQMEQDAVYTEYNTQKVLLGNQFSETVTLYRKLPTPYKIDGSDMGIIPDNYYRLDGINEYFDIFDEYNINASNFNDILAGKSEVWLGQDTQTLDNTNSVGKPVAASVGEANVIEVDFSGKSLSDLYDTGFLIRGIGNQTAYESSSNNLYVTHQIKSFVLTNGSSNDYEADYKVDIGSASNVSNALSIFADAINDNINTSTHDYIHAEVQGTKLVITSEFKGTEANNDVDEANTSSHSNDYGLKVLPYGRDYSALGSIGAGSPGEEISFSGGSNGRSSGGGGGGGGGGGSSRPKPPDPDARGYVMSSATVSSSSPTASHCSIDIGSNTGFMITGYGSYSNAKAYIVFDNAYSEDVTYKDGIYHVHANADIPDTYLTGNGSTYENTNIKFSINSGKITFTCLSNGSAGNGAKVQKYPLEIANNTIKSFDGSIDNKQTATDPNGMNAHYQIDLSGYTNVEDLISELTGKAIQYDVPPYKNSTDMYYEFIDTSDSTSTKALAKIGVNSRGKYPDFNSDKTDYNYTDTTTIDLNEIRDAVNNSGVSIIDAFVDVMQSKNANIFQPAYAVDGDSTTAVIGLNIMSHYANVRGNDELVYVKEGSLRHYDINFQDFFNNNPNLANADALNSKGFCFYCATDNNQWFNIDFNGSTDGSKRPDSGNGTYDIKTIEVNVANLDTSDFANELIQAIYDATMGGNDPKFTGSDPNFNHNFRIAIDKDNGILQIYDKRRYWVNDMRDFNYQGYDSKTGKRYGAKIADGIYDNIYRNTKDLYVKNLVIQHTDKQNMNIHLQIPQTTLDHIFEPLPGVDKKKIQDYSVLYKEDRDLLLGKFDYTLSNYKEPTDTDSVKGIIDRGLAYLTEASVLVGAQAARLDYTLDNVINQNENTQFAESTIRDADMAKEITDYTKQNVLVQSAQAMLAQANQNLSGVLSLLR